VPMVSSIEEWKRPLTHTSIQRFGRDFRIDGYLHDPWA
jgi:hypothetical protein